MSIPKAVSEAARAADELHKQTYAPEGEAPTEENQPVVLEEPKAETPASAPAPAPQPKVEDASYWEQRFKTLKGKYDSEIPRTVAQLRQAEQDNRQLTQRVFELEDQLKKALASDKGTKFSASDDEPLVSEEEKAEYGPEFTAFIERIAKTAASKTAKTSHPAPAPQPAAAPQARPVGQTVYQTLDQQAPRWREINKDPEFVGWLQHPDPLSGSTRHHMLQAAFTSQDAPRVLAFFQSYANSSGQSLKAADPAPSPAPAKVSLEQLAGPRANAPSGAQSNPPAKRVWTGKDIEAFYRKAVAGHYRGKEAEKARIEGEIAEAIAEGRVQTGR